MGMTEFDDAVPNYDYEKSATYAGWPAGTEIKLVNVPWNNDYRDIVAFDSQPKLDAYLNSRPNSVTHPESSYSRMNAPIRIATPFPVAMRYNYVRVKNPRAAFVGDEPTAFYYFITDVAYLSAGTTLIAVQLDVWSTFGHLVTFGRCFIERGHIGIANTNQFDNYGRTFLAEPEGFDTGSEYRTTLRRRHILMDPVQADNEVPESGSAKSKPMVLVLSTMKLNASIAEFGTPTDPKIVTAKPATYGGVPVGLGAYLFADVAGFAAMMEALAAYPWIIAGIHSVTVIPDITRYHTSTGGSSWQLPNGASVSLVNFDGLAEPRPLRTKLQTNWREASLYTQYIPARYRRLMKFRTSPYTMVEATVWGGSVLTMRPENWNDADATFTEWPSLLPPAQRATFSPAGYNAQNANFDYADGDDGGDHLNMALSIDAFVNVPIMNDAAALALAQNAHGLAFAQQSIDWAQQRTQAGIATSYDQASNAINTSTAQTQLGNQYGAASTDVQNDYRMQQALMGGGIGTVTGGALGAMGGPAGAAAGAATGALGGVVGLVGANAANAQASQLQALTASQNTAMNNLGGASAAYMRDTNQQLAQFAARGDYQNAIAGLQAKIQDTRLTPPSVTGNIGGDVMRILNDKSELSVRWKMIDVAHMTQIGEFWLRYGYAVNRFAKVSQLQLMSHFTYWKMSETYVSAGPMPETYKQAIRGIFEKGVTVWRDPDYIGNIDPADNVPTVEVSL